MGAVGDRGAGPVTARLAGAGRHGCGRVHGAPCYFAWLVWPGVASARVPADFYLELATQYVVEEATDGFTFRVLLRATPLPFADGRRRRGRPRAGGAAARGVARGTGRRRGDELMTERVTMDLFDKTRAVERPRFFDGQQLFAEDLDGIADFHRAMRWLHNRSLHQPGIGNGFAVAGRRGEREVRVQPGYALDRNGAEIILLDTHVEPVPPVSSESDGGPVFFDLTVVLSVRGRARGGRDARGRLPAHAASSAGGKQPVFCWVRLGRDRSGRCGRRARRTRSTSRTPSRSSSPGCRCSSAGSTPISRSRSGVARVRRSSRGSPAGATAWHGGSGR